MDMRRVQKDRHLTTELEKKADALSDSSRDCDEHRLLTKKLEKEQKCSRIKKNSSKVDQEWVSSFLTTHQHR